VQQARIILADEPIASLDPESARRVMEILADINREDGITVLVSLHQVGFALRYCRRVVALRAGRVAYDGATAAVTPAMLKAIWRRIRRRFRRGRGNAARRQPARGARRRARRRLTRSPRVTPFRRQTRRSP
jgi:phosphonate transport system ATP-binding protein